MDFAPLICIYLMCFQASGDDHFQRCPGGRSYTDNIEQVRSGKDFVSVSDRFSPVGTLSTFNRPSCNACCSHRRRTTGFAQSLSIRYASRRAAVATHVNLTIHSTTPSAQHCIDSKCTGWRSEQSVVCRLATVQRHVALHRAPMVDQVSAIPERDLRVLKSSTWSASQHTSKTTGNVWVVPP